MKRILDCGASDFQQMNAASLKQSIRAAEGRTILSEVVVSSSPLVPHLTNAEIAKAHGADLVLLNLLDVFSPEIAGAEEENPIEELKKLAGVPVGVNLEPVDTEAAALEKTNLLPAGRKAGEGAFKKAVDLGVDFICLTGNPKTGVTNKEIISAVRKAKENHGSDLLVIAGKMHSAGSSREYGSAIITKEEIKLMADAGADILLLPAPGTVPGMTVDKLQPMIETAKNSDMLTLGAIGTSQEGADSETIRSIALMNKQAGFDIHHIGDAGWQGIALPENIETYSTAVRGKRHTLARKAASVYR